MGEISLWESIWQSQGKRCASCGKEVELKDTAKNSHSLKIVCQGCYSTGGIDAVIFDELVLEGNKEE